MEIQQMRSFIAVAQTLNFNLAASQLFISQSTLSRHIFSLEKSLGVTLFERGKKFSGVKLTRAGAAILPHIRSILNEVDATQSFAKQLHGYGHEDSILTLGFDSRIIFTNFYTYLNQYRSKYPNVKVNIYDTSGTALFEKLRNNSVDVGITFHFTKVPEEGLDVRVLTKLPLYLRIHSDTLTRLGTSNPADILRMLPFYVTDINQDLTGFYIGVAQAMGISPNTVHCENNPELWAYVSSGQGVSMSYRTKAEQDPALIGIPIPHEYGMLPVYGAISARHATDTAKAFLTNCIEVQKQIEVAEITGAR